MIPDFADTVLATRLNAAIPIAALETMLSSGRDVLLIVRDADEFQAAKRDLNSIAERTTGFPCWVRPRGGSVFVITPDETPSLVSRTFDVLVVTPAALSVIGSAPAVQAAPPPEAPAVPRKGRKAVSE